MSSRYTYAEAAAELRVTETWLRRHITKLPHSKKGRVITFSDADLERIDALFHREPTSGPLAKPLPTVGGHPLAHLTPMPRRGQRLKSA